ncbi:glycyl-radical enzyme activating protein [Marinilabilia sp.]|uniref:glycyl-radical enzyme activating protein n=1 Tax=Marinilabilia sp. TaxID=2021252 RepID=UPI0025C3971A|nr:glycyl-radical enzyme activating protein [Marinilabilia sp.]
MKGLVFDIKKFAVHDGPGIRTTVFLKGCPLKCAWCHNPESICAAIKHIPRIQRVGGSSFEVIEQVGREMTPNEVLNEILTDRVFMEESGGGVTFSGGEPFLQYAFMLEVMIRCRDKGIHTVVDTSAYTDSDKLMKVAQMTDLFLVDLKVMDDNLHQKHTGVSNKIILKNVELLSEEKRSLRIRIPVIPGVSFSKENIMQVINFLKHLPQPPEGVDLLPFHRIGDHKYERLGLPNSFRNVKHLNLKDLAGMRQQFEEAGIRAHIGG